MSNAERAVRILDTAADLLLRHGYRRVTVDDVATGAGIGKGTVYLHWKTREQLFGTVFAREVLRATDELRRALRQDPRTVLLHRFAHAYFVALSGRPLMRRFLLGDPELLGKLVNAPDTARDERHAALAGAYFALLAERGLLRDDLTADQVARAYQATFEGFLRAEEPPDLLAATVRRAFESTPEPPESVVRDLAAALIALLDDLIDTELAEFGIPSL